jgi:hypothetical protein
LTSRYVVRSGSATRHRQHRCKILSYPSSSGLAGGAIQVGGMGVLKPIDCSAEREMTFRCALQSFRGPFSSDAFIKSSHHHDALACTASTFTRSMFHPASRKASASSPSIFFVSLCASSKTARSRTGASRAPAFEQQILNASVAC